MKKSLHVLVILFISMIFMGEAQSQTITTQGLSGPCNGITLNFVHSGTYNSRNQYTSGSYYLRWAGTQWEVGAGSSIYAYMAGNSTPNPLNSTAASAMGTPWTGVGSCSGTQWSVTGSGTQSTLVLPVELVYFEGKSNKNSIELDWETASELNNEKFQIEESQNGFDFYNIDEVDGQGTSIDQAHYSYQVHNPEHGLHYFRLKQVDYEGKFSFSNVITVFFNGNSSTIGALSPNPSKSGTVVFNYLSKANGILEVFIYDVAGKLKDHKALNIFKGNNALNLDLASLTSGIYFVKIGNHTNATYQKLSIQ